MLHWMPVDGARAPGGPVARWEDELRSFAQERRQRWYRMAQDRDAWAALEEECVSGRSGGPLLCTAWRKTAEGAALVGAEAPSAFTASQVFLRGPIFGFGRLRLRLRLVVGLRWVFFGSALDRVVSALAHRRGSALEIYYLALGLRFESALEIDSGQQEGY